MRCITSECVSYNYITEPHELTSTLDLCIVVLGALHGLVLLPILLSMFGGEGMALLTEFDEDGFGWFTGRRGNALLIEDNESSDQVLITDLSDEDQRQRSQGYNANNRMSIE